MAIFYQQPRTHRFGNALKRNLTNDKWRSFDAAVAWIRSSGIRHLRGPLEHFLARGARVTIRVGVDLSSTSYEALDALLALEAHGPLDVYIYHNEAASTFHPKLYLFRSEDRARLIVGSNNLTDAGLFRNVEAGLEIEGERGSGVIMQAEMALAAWMDEGTGLVKGLDKALLEQLLERGYVKREKDLGTTPDERQAADANGGEGQPLFATQPVGSPSYSSPPPDSAGPRDEEYAPGQVLLMRVRTARGTQVQFPLRIVRDSAFFGGIEQIVSAHDGEAHGLHPARAHGKINTLKVEIPETGSVNDPVLRLERTDRGIVYEVRDAESYQGKPIMDALRAGRASGETFLTLPSDPDRSTWVRFI